ARQWLAVRPPLRGSAQGAPPHDRVVAMETQYLVETFEIEGKLLDATLRHHPALCPLFSRDFRDVNVGALKRAYLQLLKLKADYVQYTVPALRAAGEALRGGDDEDRAWSSQFLDYASGETDG